MCRVCIYDLNTFYNLCHIHILIIHFYCIKCLTRDTIQKHEDTLSNLHVDGLSKNIFINKIIIGVG